jgi:chemotaxis signal transduction protein
MLSETKKSRAWIFSLSGKFWGAVGEREMVHLVESPILLEVPHSPSYCRHVLIWNERLLPAFDLAAWLHGRSIERSQCLAGLVVYQNPNAELQYGALLLADLPQCKPVSDDQACPLPSEPLNWQSVAVSCFADGESVVPILNLPYIFSDALLNP